jgi:hypothetical protein
MLPKRMRMKSDDDACTEEDSCFLFFYTVLMWNFLSDLSHGGQISSHRDLRVYSTNVYMTIILYNDWQRVLTLQLYPVPSLLPPHLASAQVHARKHRIMIANNRCIFHPRVQVNVLHDRLGQHAGTGIHVIDLLQVHVKQVRVAVGRGHSKRVVEVEEARAGHKCSEGSNKGEFVEVTRDEDRGARVLRENLADEVLEMTPR